MLIFVNPYVMFLSQNIFYRYSLLKIWKYHLLAGIRSNVRKPNVQKGGMLYSLGRIVEWATEAKCSTVVREGWSYTAAIDDREQ